MATDKLLGSTFYYGDSVRVKKDAPLNYKPSSVGNICGIRKMDNYENAKRNDLLTDLVLYLVEFEDGQTLEIPGNFLIPINL